MADSNTTKQALASALKKLLEDTPFKKIRVADICGQCHMNRKSFYYHFRDKYDLINWIFDTEVRALLWNHRSGDHWETIGSICHYLYENREFYCKVSQFIGQNSLPEHFRDFLLPLLEKRLGELFGPGDPHRIGLNFFADGMVCAIMRWLTDKDCIPPEQFVSFIRKVVESAAVKVYEDITHI